MTDIEHVFRHWLSGLVRALREGRLLRVFCLPLFLVAASLAQATTATFTSSGTWTAPAGVTSVDVEVWGGGGAGGGQDQNSDGGGGGGGGAYSKKLSITVVPGNSYTVSVGAGGVGVTGGSGGTGGDSYFINVTTVMAKGGAGGQPSTGTPPAGGLGGAAASGVGDVKYSGGDGGRGRNNGTGRGGPGGSSAGTGANGTDGPDPYSTTTAAAPPVGGGIGGDGGSNGNDGNAPASGRGGGGGGSGDGNSMIGGNGAGGQVLITYVAPFACTPPGNTPAGVTLSCVCDNFARPTLNPSPIFGSNWIVSTSDSTGILPSIVNSGYLRLTNNTGNNAKAATVPGIFPAAGNYISVEFQQYAYNGTGADGIAVTLSDYAVPAVPGAYGGSLGYAQETGIHDGFAGGWLGVALDEYGNYQNTNEGRLGGPGFIVQSVGARGSGSGQTGYRWLGGTNTLSPPIDNNTSTSRSLGYYYQVIVDARNDPTSTTIAVNRDTGSGYSSLINIPNVYTAATAQGFTQAPVPVNWQVSFTGSTGGSTNIHEIGGLRICAQTVVPPTGGTASGFNAIDEAYGTPALDVQKYLNGHIYMKVVGQPFKLNVAALNNNQIQTAYVVSGTKPVTVNLVDNSDGVCVLDNTKPNYCSATCKAKPAVSGGNQTLSFATSNAGQKQSANFTLNTAYRNLVAIISDGTVTACSTDAFSVRPASIAAVVSTNATNGAVGNTGGAPVFKAGSDNFSMTLTTTGVAGNPSGYTGTAKIDNTLVTVVSPATVAGQVAPALFPAAVSGTPSSTATGTTFTYSEVGAFLLPGYPTSDTSSPRGVYDGVRTATECTALTVAQCDTLKGQTWTGVDSVSASSDCLPDSYSNAKATTPPVDVGKYGCNFGLVASTAGIGRFVPYEFAVVSPVLTNRQTAACAVASTFSYLDEGMRLSYTLEARSATGNITKNYAGGFAKLTLPVDGSGSSMNFAAAVVGPPFVAISSNRIVGSAFTASWPAPGAATAGQLALSGTVTVSSLTIPSNNRVSPDGPFTNAKIGIAPVDSDGVRIMTYDLDSDNSGGAGGPDHATLGTTNLYFGEIRLLPAIGSERLPLTMTAEILRWNGTGFAPNGDDSCTQVPAARLGLSGWTKNLSVGETTLPAGPLAFAAGRGTLRLSAPGAGNDGSVLITADLTTAGLTYLSGRWSGAIKYNQNPSAIAAFGLYKGAGPVIHFRENY